MHDLKFYDQVLSFTFDFDSFCLFEDQFDDIDYDTDDSFAKYFSLDLIRTGLDKFKAGEIDIKYFSHWCMAYKYIVSAYRTKHSCTSFVDEIQSVIAEEVAYALDWAAYSYENPNRFDPDDVLRQFTLLNDIYQNSDQWLAFYSPTELTEIVDDQYVLFYNSSKQCYTMLILNYIDNGYNDDKMIFLTEEELIAKINNIKSKGYKFLRYSYLDFFNAKIWEALTKGAQIS